MYQTVNPTCLLRLHLLYRHIFSKSRAPQMTIIHLPSSFLLHSKAKTKPQSLPFYVDILNSNPSLASCLISRSFLKFRNPLRVPKLILNRPLPVFGIELKSVILHYHSYFLRLILVVHSFLQSFLSPSVFCSFIYSTNICWVAVLLIANLWVYKVNWAWFIFLKGSQYAVWMSPKPHLLWVEKVDQIIKAECQNVEVNVTAQDYSFGVDVFREVHLIERHRMD